MSAGSSTCTQYWTAPLEDPAVPLIRGSSIFILFVCLYVSDVFTTPIYGHGKSGPLQFCPLSLFVIVIKNLGKSLFSDY